MIDFLSVVLAIILLIGLFFQIKNTLNSIDRLKNTLNSIDSLYNIYNQTSLDSIDKNKGKNLDSIKLNNNMTTKKYKLLKDLPFAKAGTIITHNPNDEFICQEFSLHFSEYDLLQKYITNADWFEPIIEKPKQILKYANGAVMESLEIGDDYFSICGDYLEEWTWEDQTSDLVLRNVFLTQLEAQRAHGVQLAQNRLLKKIAEIDANNNWVADWGNIDQKKYFLSFDHDFKELDKNFIPNTGKYANREYNSQTNNVYMSEQAKNYMMSDEVSLEDFKLFLGIKNNQLIKQ